MDGAAGLAENRSKFAEKKGIDSHYRIYIPGVLVGHCNPKAWRPYRMITTDAKRTKADGCGERIDHGQHDRAPGVANVFKSRC